MSTDHQRIAIEFPRALVSNTDSGASWSALSGETTCGEGPPASVQEKLAFCLSSDLRRRVPQMNLAVGIVSCGSGTVQSRLKRDQTSRGMVVGNAGRRSASRMR